MLGAAASVLVGTLGWVMAETVALSDDAANALNPAALWTVLWETPFGLACLVRAGLLMLSVAACFAVHRPKARRWAQMALGGAVMLSFAWTGHGAVAIGKTAGIHLAADFLHLIAAGIWIGALVPLTVLAVAARRSGASEDAHALQAALSAFSQVGMWVVAVVIFSGVVNSIYLLNLAQWRDALNSAYGKVLLVKLAVFGGMLGLAAFNRYRISRVLDGGSECSGGAPVIDAARSSLVAETLLAALLLGAVSVLGTLPPPDARVSCSRGSGESPAEWVESIRAYTTRCSGRSGFATFRQGLNAPFQEDVAVHTGATQDGPASRRREFISRYQSVVGGSLLRFAAAPVPQQQSVARLATI